MTSGHLVAVFGVIFIAGVHSPLYCEGRYLPGYRPYGQPIQQYPTYQYHYQGWPFMDYPAYSYQYQYPTDQYQGRSYAGYPDGSSYNYNSPSEPIVSPPANYYNHESQPITSSRAADVKSLSFLDFLQLVAAAQQAQHQPVAEKPITTQIHPDFEIPSGIADLVPSEEESGYCPPNDPERNKIVAALILKEAFGDKNVDNLAKYIDKDYIQHNPNIGDGLDGLVDSLTYGPFKDFPKRDVDIRNIGADGDLVWIHHKYGKFAKVEIHRFKCGKAVEHWDVMQDTTGVKSANPHPFF